MNSNYNRNPQYNQRENVPGFELYQGVREQPPNFYNSLTGIQELNNLSITFFSKINIDKIQLIIQRRILNEINEKISRQSDLELQIIMKSIYLENSKNNPNNIEQQVNELNELVINEAVRIIKEQIYSYKGYRRDISTPRYILPHSVNPSSAGEKTYQLINFGNCN